MTLTGVDPLDPTPSDRRELILGAGPGSSGGTVRTVVLYGNKQATGSETVDTLDPTLPILDEADCVTRFGRRSEVTWMYRYYVAVDPSATIYGAAVTESVGNAAHVEFAIAGGASATANSTLRFTIMGRTVDVAVTSGDLVATVVANAVVALNDAEQSSLPIVVTDASPNVTVTHVHKGPRHGQILGGAGFGCRARFTVPCTLTVTKAAVTAGTTEDDGTAVIASAMNHENYYHVLPWITTAPLATDNQLGEFLAAIVAQAAPANGKEQLQFSGFTGTQGAHTTQCVALNSTRAHSYWAENNDLPGSMIAAHCAAVKRVSEVAHPSANIAGYCATDNTPWTIPAPALIADRPSATEVRADLNNGGSPIATRPNGKTYLVRDISSRSESATGDKDYKAREGHILSAVTFAWQLFADRYAAQKQPFVDDNPAAGQMPKARTTTPDSVRSIMIGVIDDLTSSKPLGIYDGPVLAPSKADKMKASIITAKIPAGVTISAELFAIEHNLKSETKILEVGDAY
jgi:phage tail sheath gpL-like